MAETLIRFLDSLGEPVIPYSNFDQLMECTTANQCKSILNSLPAAHYNTFFYIIAFLRELLTHSEKNNLSADKLGKKSPQVPHLTLFICDQQLCYLVV
jgi:phosphatidylinositol-bisphosphatase